MVCQPAVARAEILSQRVLKPLVPVVRFGGAVDRVICLDVDGDGARDMAFSVASGGTAGDMDWVVMLRARGGWRVVRFGHGYKLGLARRGAGLVVTQPVYRRNDANCCPSGGFDHVVWRWRQGRLAVVHRRHDRSPDP